MVERARQIALSRRSEVVGIAFLPAFFAFAFIMAALERQKDGMPGWMHPDVWLVLGLVLLWIVPGTTFSYRDYARRRGRRAVWDEYALWVANGGKVEWRVEWDDYRGFRELPWSVFGGRGVDILTRSDCAALRLPFPTPRMAGDDGMLLKRLLTLSVPADGAFPVCPEYAPPSKKKLVMTALAGLIATAAGTQLWLFGQRFPVEADWYLAGAFLGYTVGPALLLFAILGALRPLFGRLGLRIGPAIERPKWTLADTFAYGVLPISPAADAIYSLGDSNEYSIELEDAEVRLLVRGRRVDARIVQTTTRFPRSLKAILPSGAIKFDLSKLTPQPPAS